MRIKMFTYTNGRKLVYEGHTDSMPRKGETILFGEGEFYKVKNVIWDARFTSLEAIIDLGE